MNRKRFFSMILAFATGVIFSANLFLDESVSFAEGEAARKFDFRGRLATETEPASPTNTLREKNVPSHRLSLNPDRAEEPAAERNVAPKATERREEDLSEMARKLEEELAKEKSLARELNFDSTPQVVRAERQEEEITSSTATQTTGDFHRNMEEVSKQAVSLTSQLEEQSHALEGLRQTRTSLQSKITRAESRIRELVQELEQAQNRLLIAETEVERLSSILEQRSTGAANARQMEKTFSSREATPKRVSQTTRKRPATDPFFNEKKVSDDMPIVTVVTNKANLRTGPGLNNSPLMTVSKGTRLAVETRQGEWYRVIAPTGARAWVSGTVVQFGKDKYSQPTRTFRVKSFSPEADSDEAAAIELIRNRS